jgi:hypothetical protein
MFDDDDEEDDDRFESEQFDMDQSYFDGEDVSVQHLGEDYFADGKILPNLRIFEIEYRMPDGETDFIEVVGDEYDQDERGCLHICVGGKKMATWNHGVWLSIRYINSCRLS